MHLHETAKKNVPACRISALKGRIDALGDFKNTPQERTGQKVLPALSRKVNSAYEAMDLV